MSLTASQKSTFRARGHNLKPVVIIGNAGLSTAVIRELDLSLEHHELIKIRISSADREQRKKIIEQACSACHAESVQSIGSIALIYRKRTQ